MEVLIFVQTPGELEWARRQAASAGQSARHSWSILRLGDASLVSIDKRSWPERCRFLSTDELEIDSERVWQETRELQAEFWSGVSDEPARQLHLGVQGTIGEYLLSLAYARAVVAAALEQLSPDEVRVPPAFGSVRRGNAPLAFDRLQEVVYFISSRRGTRCRRSWSAALAQASAGALAVAEQLVRFGALVLSDLVRLLGWMAASAFGRFNAPSSSEARREEKGGEDSGAIILANADGDLDRQFDPRRISAELAARCLVWIPLLNRLIPFTDALWQERLMPAYLNGRRSEAEELVLNNYTGLARATRRIFPVLLSPLVMAHSRLWFCSPFTRAGGREDGEAASLGALYGARGLAGERLVNWRRIVFAARNFGQTVELLRSLGRPSLLVTGDTVDIHRFTTLGARHAGVRTLATTHGVQMWSENFVEPYALADVHALFSQSSILLTDKNLPGRSHERVVCHDSFPVQEENQSPRVAGPDNARPRRVIVFTSFYSSMSTGWTNNLFLRPPDYADSLRALVEALSNFEPGLELTIKSHPLSDQYELYDEIERDFPSVVRPQWRAPLMVNEAIPADVIVFFNCVSTSFFYAVHQNIPLVGHWGSLTSIARRVVALTGLLGSERSEPLADIIREILQEPAGERAREALMRARAVRDEFIRPSAGGLNEAINFALAGGQEEKKVTARRSTATVSSNEEKRRGSSRESAAIGS
jgi:hypothetical protein